jgi:hypothetical protein
METVRYAETSVQVYRITERCISEYRSLHEPYVVHFERNNGIYIAEEQMKDKCAIQLTLITQMT